MQSIRVYPRLSACLRFSFTLLGGIIAFLVIFTLIAGLIKGHAPEFPSLETLERTLLAVAVVRLGIGVFLFWTLWVYATIISDAGLRGPTFWARRITIGWNDVASVERITVKGIPYLIVKSASSKRELWLCRLGLDVSRIHRHSGFCSFKSSFCDMVCSEGSTLRSDTRAIR
jgi:hypothetical protein